MTGPAVLFLSDKNSHPTRKRLHHGNHLRGSHDTNLLYPRVWRLAFMTHWLTHTVTLSLVMTAGCSCAGHPSAVIGSASLPHSATEPRIWGLKKKKKEKKNTAGKNKEWTLCWNEHTNACIHAGELRNQEGKQRAFNVVNTHLLEVYRRTLWAFNTVSYRQHWKLNGQYREVLTHKCVHAGTHTHCFMEHNIQRVLYKKNSLSSVQLFIKWRHSVLRGTEGMVWSLKHTYTHTHTHTHPHTHSAEPVYSQTNQ